MLTIKNKFTDQLEADPSQNHCPREVYQHYSFVQPAVPPSPVLRAVSQPLTETLGLKSDFIESESFVRLFSGTKPLPDMKPYAMCYGGHQFGHWAGQLGDGRAINLSECTAADGQLLTLQLKGAGPTPYSRTADGYAVMRSSIREFLCSEAMHHLGVPTTRALSLISTGKPITRDMFYDGRPEEEEGAVVCRVAPSFIRFGSFEILAWRQQNDNLKALADYTINTHFPHLDLADEHVYLRWFEEICDKTALMIAHWMCLGFVHGVMNTDNLSILGLTIDYGPYGWLDDFDPNWTPNTTDAQNKRYAYGNQPQIAQWNLYKLANALQPIANDAEGLVAAIEGFTDKYSDTWQSMMTKKLGLQGRQPTDLVLFEELMNLLAAIETDMTIFFRQLANIELLDDKLYDFQNVLAVLASAYYEPEQCDENYQNKLEIWFNEYRSRIKQGNQTTAQRKADMDAVNPKYIFRNYLAQLAIDDANKDDYTEVNRLLRALEKPYDEQPEYEDYAKKRPDWAKHRAGCSMLSCSS